MGPQKRPMVSLAMSASERLVDASSGVRPAPDPLPSAVAAQGRSARLRRMVDGQHHHVSPRHLHAYAAHAAWMEDHRRIDNGALAKRVLTLAMAHPVSRQWKGYWQQSRAV